VGEAKWTKKVNGERIQRSLEDKARHLPVTANEMIYVACAREKVTPSGGLRTVTARHIFGR
jgi:hypothetical protein